MFDYDRLENSIILQMENIIRKYAKEYKDIYIIALDCSGEMDSLGVIANTESYLSEQTDTDSSDYWYYKFCEEEWEIFDTFEEISFHMRNYMEENQELFSDSETCTYTEAFDKHCDKVIMACENALCRLKKSSICEAYPEILLTFNIREYFDEEERVMLFEKLNGETAAKEYAEHIEEFC